MRLKKIATLVLTFVLMASAVSFPAIAAEVSVKVYDATEFQEDKLYVQFSLLIGDDELYADDKGTPFEKNKTFDFSGTMVVTDSDGNIVNAEISKVFPPFYNETTPTHITFIGVPVKLTGKYTVTFTNVTDVFYKLGDQYLPIGTLSKTFFVSKPGASSTLIKSVSAKSASGELSADDFVVDLESGNLLPAAGYGIAAYSLDGGTTWKAGSITQKIITGMFKKGGTIALTDSYNTKTKKPAVSENIVLFPKVNAAPKANDKKSKPWYYWESNSYTSLGKEIVTFTNYFSLTSGTNETVLYANGVLQVCEAGDDKKPNGRWVAWNNKGEIGSPAMNGEPADKRVYFFRYPPSENADGSYTPPSAPWKVSPSTPLKPVMLKADYKKEMIKVKSGYIIDGEPVTTSGTMSIKEYLDNNVKSINIYVQPTGKKPGSEEGYCTFATRWGAGLDHDVEIKDGKFVASTIKRYEFSTDKAKWGGLPKITSTTTIYARVKPTARYDKYGDVSGYAASSVFKVEVTYGTYTDNKGKEKRGIIDFDSIVDSTIPDEPAEPDPIPTPPPSPSPSPTLPPLSNIADISIKVTSSDTASLTGTVITLTSAAFSKSTVEAVITKGHAAQIFTWANAEGNITPDSTLTVTAENGTTKKTYTFKVPITAPQNLKITVTSYEAYSITSSITWTQPDFALVSKFTVVTGTPANTLAMYTADFSPEAEKTIVADSRVHWTQGTFSPGTVLKVTVTVVPKDTTKYTAVTATATYTLQD